jgi:hypothetical protein
LLTPAQLAAQPHVLYSGEAGPAYQDPIQWRNLEPPTQYIPAGKTVADDSGGPNATLSQNYNHHGFGPEITLGQRLSDISGGQTIGIAKYSGATNLHDHWQPTFAGGSSFNPYHEMISQVVQSIALLPVQRGGDTGYLAGILWVQGEADALDQRTEAQYATDLTNFIAQLRSDLAPYTQNPASPDALPFVFSLINNAGGTNDQIRAAQYDVGATVPGAYLIETDSFSRDMGTVSIDGNPPVLDDVHYDNLGQMQLGNAAAERFALVSAPEPASLSLLALAALPMLARRRRRS